MSNAHFTPPGEAEDGILKLARIEDFDPRALADSPPGIIGIYTDAGRHFSVVVGGFSITDQD